MKLVEGDSPLSQIATFILEEEWDKCRENREKGGGFRNVLIRDTAATPFAGYRATEGAEHTK